MQEHGWRKIELQQRVVEMEVHQVDEWKREQMSEYSSGKRLTFENSVPDLGHWIWNAVNLVKIWRFWVKNSGRISSIDSMRLTL